MVEGAISELEVCRGSPYKTCALPYELLQTVDESFGLHALIGP